MKLTSFLILVIFTNLASLAPTDQDQTKNSEDGRILRTSLNRFIFNGGKCCLNTTSSDHGPCCAEHVATCGSWEEVRQVLDKCETL